MIPPDRPAGTATPHDLTLLPTLLLRAPAPPPPLTGRISLGTPVVRPLTGAQAAEGDGDWGAFLESEADRYDYLLLSLVCSFRPSTDGAPFTDAGIGIRLEAPGLPADHQPIAWSLSPKRRAVPAAPSGSLTLTANLVLVDAGVEYSPGGGGQEKLFVVGMGERDSDPEWRFTATPDTPLVGDESLALIVRTPAGAPARAHVTVAATVRQRRLGLIPYRAELPPALRTVTLR
ncbi:hypothetical protein [Streptomyces sp. WAC08241]|uniref:hypothetical protein n=1 Tax=Streptomyces sp. WAC08241 TaxID=2487421 RepID=UPI000F790829|nr:hypothetical protein [Streptomyces sp. WAC08241]RSS36443.1 hypothetical protein EF906_25295 [Streptomyces sp. WAC08241]